MADLRVSIAGLRTRITLQTPTITTGSGGFQTTSYGNANNPNVWAHIVYDHGDELTQSDARTSLQRATVTIRYRSDIKSTWRILMGGEAWQIITPPENVRNENRWTVFRIEQVKGTV